MRLAILADIHGNLAALEAVLADAREQGADELLVNGDMVNRGPQNVQVLERLVESGAELLLGNHDDLMRMWIERDAGLPTEWFGSPFWEGTAWCARQLERDGWIELLRGLPLMSRPAGRDAPRVLVAHGSPRHYREGYGRSLSDEDIDDIADRFEADILVGSHTHIPMARKHGRRLVLNTGAVGAPFNGDPRAQYLLLEQKGNEWQPEFRRIPYDRERTLREFDRSGFLEEGGLSARIFYQEFRSARSLLTPFIEWVQSAGVTLDEAGWRRFQEEFPERFPTTVHQ